MKALRLALDSLRIDIGSFVMLFVGYLIFPLFMSNIFIYIGSLDTTEVEPKIKLEIQDEDQSEISTLYSNMFEASGLIEENHKPDYVLTLPEGFAESVLSADPKAAPELNDAAGSRTGKAIITILHDSVSSTIRRQIELSDAVSKSGISAEEGQKLLTRAAGLETEVSQMIDTEILDKIGRDRKQATRDNIAMGYLGFLMLMFSINIPGSETNARKTGLDRRIHSTPTRRGTTTIATFIHFTFVAALVMVAYMLIHRYGGAFSGSFPLHILIAVCFFMIFAAAVMVINSIIPKPEYSTFLLTMIMMIQTFGVSFSGASSSQELSGFASFVEKIRPDKAMVQMMDRNITGTFGSSDLLTLGALVLGAIVLLSFAVFLQNRKKEIVA